jgi:hypothetical protein
MMLRVDPNDPCIATGKLPAKVPDVPKFLVKEQLSEEGKVFWEEASKHCASQTAVVFVAF